MGPWSLVVDVVRALVFSAAHLFGGSVGAGVLAVSIVARIALLPVTLRIARKALEHQRRLAALAPEREVLKRRFAKDPLRLAEEVAALHQRHGIGPVPEGMLRNIAIQLPINAALYQAIARGLGRSSWAWVADLTKPDIALAGVAAVVAGIAAGVAPNSSRSALIVSTLLTFAIAWRLSAGLGLYWLGSNAVGVGQSLILRRSISREPRSRA